MPNGSSRRVNIHPDRVFILGDYSDDAIGFLEPAYNAFVSLEKVEGGSGESFLKNAARQLNVNFEKEIDFNNLASLYGVSIDELQDKFNEVAGEINRGNDVLMTTQGATVTPLVSAVADPSATYNVNLQTAAAGVDIPTRILVGNQQAERSSTEDQKYSILAASLAVATCHSRLRTSATPGAAPGVPLKAIKWMFQRHAPLAISLDGTQFQLKWMWQMLRNCDTRHYMENKGRMVRLAEYSRDCLKALRASTGIEAEGRQGKTLQLFRTEQQYENATRDIAVLEDAGAVPYQLLEASQLGQVELGAGGSGAQADRRPAPAK